MQIICNQTQDVLLENSFDDVELSTVLTVFDQEELNIKSELDLFSAISRYAARHNQTSGAKVPRLDGIGKFCFILLTSFMNFLVGYIFNVFHLLFAGF